MLQKMPTILTISDLRMQAKEILKQSAEQPVVITQNGRPSAVLVNYETFNQMIDKLNELEGYQQQERQSWSQLSVPALTRVWDNEQDAAYDEWRSLYGVPAR